MIAAILATTLSAVAVVPEPERRLPPTVLPRIVYVERSDSCYFKPDPPDPRAEWANPRECAERWFFVTEDGWLYVFRPGAPARRVLSMWGDR